ncbi:MAG TPA: hypothetical protein VGL20_20980 [Candidatus Dormibacteraeota bacterium]|jgi:hypothetical protein
MRRWRLPILVLLSVSVAGCVNDIPSDQPPAVTARPAPSAAPPSPVHLVVLQRHADPAGGDRIAITGRGGRLEAEATFRPPPPPSRPEPQVAAGAVHFLDAAGMVRRLSPAGGPAQAVATLPQPGAGAVDFAVSPDGGRVMASVLTPAAARGRAGRVDLLLSVAGGAAALLRRLPVPAGATTALRVAGWDVAGPVVVPDAPITPPPGTDGGGLWRGHPAHADLRGAVGPRLGDAACALSRVQPDDGLLCVGTDGAGGSVAAVYSEGQLLHRFAGVGAAPLLAPGGERVASTSGVGRGAVEGVDGRTEVLAAAAGAPVAWLDAATVVGIGTGGLTSVALDPTGRVVELGITGEVAGVIR